MADAANPTQSIVLAPEIAAPAAATQATPVRVAAAAPSNGEPGVYSTPAPSSQTSIAPTASLANYVVAHSEYSGPISRRMALLGILASENNGAVPVQSEAVDPGAETNDAP